jgi:uncharacterized membrane protein
MRTRLICIALVVADVILFLTTGYMLASAPRKGVPKSVQAAFALKSYILVLVLLICLFITVVVVWMWAQQVREEYRDQARRNLESLIEGTLQDHGRNDS